MQKLIFFWLLLSVTFSATGQKLWQKQGYLLKYPDCYASDKIEKAFVPPPAEIMNSLKSGNKRSEIIVSYSLFPPEAKLAFDYAKSIWEGLIDSPVPIYIQANWRTKGDNVLGSCGPTDFEKNFDGAPFKNIYYPISLVEKIRGVELTGPERPDMIAEFNKDIDWYFGTDGNTPTLMYDFVSVVLHEIGHGLGFTGFFFALDLTGGYSWFDWGDATSFDKLVVNANSESLIDSSLFSNPSVSLKNQLVSNALYSNSPVAIAMGNRSRPRLYSPSVWDDGSSVYHLNDATYPSGTINTLMTHSYGRGEATHHPGPVTLGIMADLGWKNMKFDHIPLKDMETIAPLNFEVKITSDYLFDLSEIYLVYSVDSFSTTPDSIPLLSTDLNLFETSLMANSGTTVLQYYITAADTMNRVFRYPSEAPNEFFEISFGPDNILPTIDHESIPYFFDTGHDLFFVARVEDNIGIDTVYVEYSINGTAQQPFGLFPDSGSLYTGIFPLSSDQLNDKDEISYQIIAIDASTKGNIRKFPLRNTISFPIEKMFNPVTSYKNLFESDTNDFILHDFRIYLDEGFQNGALHSPHPYPSPDEDNVELNFSTTLKFPVILNDNAKMSFDEIVLVEPGSKGTEFGDFEFWDYVIVEGSKDKGNTWLPLTDGYDSRKHQIWEDSFNSSIADMNSTTVGSSDLYINNQIDMLANGNFSSGDTILIRFRLFSDPYSHGWGWAIDNLVIQSQLTTSDAVLSPGNIRVYPNPFTGIFNVVAESNDLIDLLQFEVYNMQGQKIHSEHHNNVTGYVTSEIKIENGNTGLYLLVVKENGRQVLSKKIIHN
jgi:hypothetical protein